MDWVGGVARVGERIICVQGDASRLPLPDRSVHCVVTSPPYYGLRDYGVAGQVGLEPTMGAYVARLVEVFREVRRVLRDDGTLWLNLGDSYCSDGGAGGVMASLSIGSPSRATMSRPEAETPEFRRWNRDWGTTKVGDLLGVPWRVAFALRDDGWLLRSDVVWSKSAPMPESVSGWRWERHRVNRTSECPGCLKCASTDGLVLRRGSWRPTRAHEFVFLLAKSGSYFCDAEAVRQVDGGRASGKGFLRDHRLSYGGRGDEDEWLPGGGRNPRDVWHLGPQPYPGAHFAVFPPSLVERCLLASTSERGVCPRCGAPWARVVRRERLLDGEPSALPPMRNDDKAEPSSATGIGHGRTDSVSKTLGWRATCSCDAGEPVPATVLDPFAGSGTTGAVAAYHSRDAVLVDLKREYLELVPDRVDHVRRALDRARAKERAA